MCDDKDDHAEDCCQDHAVLKTSNYGDMMTEAGDIWSSENNDNLIEPKRSTEQLWNWETSCDDDLDDYNWTVMEIVILKQAMPLMIRSMMIILAMMTVDWNDYDGMGI